MLEHRISKTGFESWYLNGRYHKEDGPAIINLRGSEEWQQDGELHRIDGPAVINSNGYEAWYKNDKMRYRAVEVTKRRTFYHWGRLFINIGIKMENLRNVCTFYFGKWF